MKPQNTLVVIGALSQKYAYLNVSKEDAIKRYLEENPECESDIDKPGFITEFEFDDVFEVYDAWPV